jgi:hypothetical protein
MDLLILLKAKLSTPDQVHKKTPSLGWGFILFLSVDSTDIFSNSFLEDLEKLVKLHRNLEQN